MVLMGRALLSIQTGMLETPPLLLPTMGRIQNEEWELATTSEELQQGWGLIADAGGNSDSITNETKNTRGSIVHHNGMRIHEILHLTIS